MKPYRSIYFLFLISVLTGCSVGIKTTIIRNYPPLDSLQEVRVVDVGQPAPSNAIDIGIVAIYDHMTIHCDSAVVYSAAKKEALKAGGNVLKITEHLYPDFVSSCHRIKGRILKADNFHDTVLTVITEKKVLPFPTIKHDSRFVLNIGWGWQTAKIPDDLNQFEKDYLNELKSGSQYGAEYNYFINERTGIGVVFNLFHSSNATYASAQSATGTIMSGKLSDDINIIYIAPSISWRILSPTKMNAFLAGISIGYLHYRDDAEFISSSATTGGTVGLSYDLSYDLGLTNKTALGFGLSWKLGTLSSLNVNQHGSSRTIQLDNDHRLGLGHIDLSLGLRFR